MNTSHLVLTLCWEGQRRFTAELVSRKGPDQRDGGEVGPLLLASSPFGSFVKYFL
jgi:hypothetical protein